MTKFWPSKDFPGIYNMVFSKKTTSRVSIPTRPSMIGSPERVKIQRSSIPKLGRFIAVFGSHIGKKTLKTVNIGKKRPNFRLKWPKFR